jgi:hypothetical protein
VRYLLWAPLRLCGQPAGRPRGPRPATRRLSPKNGLYPPPPSPSSSSPRSRAQPVLGAGPVTSSSGSDSNAFVAFQTRFRAAGDEKDAKEREGKASRKAAGKAALKKMLAERGERVATRKASNRSSEKAVESEMISALSGESWGRVSSLVTVEAAAAGGGGGGAGAEASEKKKSAAGEAGATARMKCVSGVGGGGGGGAPESCHTCSPHTPAQSTSRATPRRDILISLKTKPLAAA